MFLRKTKDSEQNKNQPRPQINESNFGTNDFKNKNFEFLKKRRIIGVQSMKVLPQYYNQNETTIKKPEFFSPNQNKYTPQINPVNCPEDKQKI